MNLAEVKSAQRVLAIIELLAERPAGLTFAELAENLGYPRSSLHGLIKTLERSGWIDHDQSHHRFALGIRSWEVGHAYLRASSLADRSRPFMERVSGASGETVQLAVLDGRDNVYVAKVEGSERLVLVSEVGRRLPAHATGLGKVLLAGLSPDQIRDLFDGVQLERFSERTISSVEALADHLEQVRRDGFATDCGEHTEGVRCIAVPVREWTGSVVAAMSVSVPTVRYTPEKREQLVFLLTREASAMSFALGHRERALLEAD